MSLISTLASVCSTKRCHSSVKPNAVTSREIPSVKSFMADIGMEYSLMSLGPSLSELTLMLEQSTSRPTWARARQLASSITELPIWPTTVK